MPLAFLFLSLVLGGSAAQEIRLTPLPQAEVGGGCGCFFRTGEDPSQTVFAQDTDQADAVVGINGNVVRTMLQDSTEEPKEAEGESIGDRFHQVQFSGDVLITLDYETIWVCPDNDEGCEVTKYKGTLTVVRGKQSRSFRVVGECGC
jgi:hypothetical protein